MVAMAATETGVVYEAVFGSRRIHEGRVMTRDTIFRVALMVKPDHDGGSGTLLADKKLRLLSISGAKWSQARSIFR